MRAITISVIISCAFLFLGAKVSGQRYSGRLSIEIKMLDSGIWKDFSSKDCMCLLDYKEGKFSFEIEAGKVFNKNGKFKAQEFLDYIDGRKTDVLSYYGNFSPEGNYLLQNPTQRVIGEFIAPTGTIPDELTLRTTVIGNDERRIQLLVEKQLDSPPLREGRKVLLLIDGIISRLD